ncbi:hypothetical protein JCM30760_27080 [Thiomicrorhabdus hydrogeniphila]
MIDTAEKLYSKVVEATTVFQKLNRNSVVSSGAFSDKPNIFVIDCSLSGKRIVAIFDDANSTKIVIGLGDRGSDSADIIGEYKPDEFSSSHILNIMEDNLQKE